MLRTNSMTSLTVQLDVSSLSSKRIFCDAGDGHISVILRIGELGVSGEACGTDTSSSSTLISVSADIFRCLLGTVAERSRGEAASAGLLTHVLR